jgi:hypothetical protein
MMRDLIIEKGSLRLDGNLLSVGVRMPWYRALPLSSVCDLVLDINGMAIDKSSTRWLINGTNYREEELPPLYKEWWFVTDTAVLSGTLTDEQVAALDLSAEQEIHVGLGIYIPYIDAGAGTLLVHEGNRTTMKIEKAAA